MAPRAEGISSPSFAPASPSRRGTAATAARLARAATLRVSGRIDVLDRRLRAEQRVGCALPSAGHDGRPASRRHMDSQGRQYVPRDGEVDFIDEHHTPMYQDQPGAIQVGSMDQFLYSDSRVEGSPQQQLPEGWGQPGVSPAAGQDSGTRQPASASPSAAAASDPSAAARAQTAQPGTRSRAAPAGAGEAVAEVRRSSASAQVAPDQAQTRAQTAPSAGHRLSAQVPTEVPVSVLQLVSQDPYVARKGGCAATTERRWTHERIRGFRVPSTKPPQVVAPQRVSPRAPRY
eukprot:TRINITY_DN5501_c0_g2_i1.p1 TRINITY_DN5501_c0_g2~~TRINITY_DN5501_c0_g2_i1.p1  ORF type:complete len:309 (+),score=36.91 TRINITY_DN5501_c0_g2_i1:61-927(+)